MTTQVINYRFRVRGGLSTALAALNEVPLEREFVLETDTGQFKFGDGATPYNDLPYPGGAGGASSAADLTFDDTNYGATLANAQEAIDTALQAPKEVYCALYRPSESVATGTSLWVWRAPEPGVIVDVYAYVLQPSSSGSTRVDVKNGTDTIFSTKPEIQASEHSTKTGVVGTLLATPVFFDIDTPIRFDVETAGSGATGLCVVIRYVPHPVYRGMGGQHTVSVWTQSSIYGGVEATAANMRDADSTTGGGTSTTSTPSWIAADLGVLRTVDRVVLGAGTLPAWGTVSSYLNGAKLQYYDGSAWVDILTVSGMTDTSPTEKEFTFTAVNARHIRIATPSAYQYLATTEFRIYGG